MSDSAAAAEHLKVIRGMMERATVYRAVSAPAAIFGGVLAVLTGGYFIFLESDGEEVSGKLFFMVWVGVLILVDIFNTFLLWKRANAADEPLFSAGMKHVCLVFGPTMVAGGILSYEIAVSQNAFELCALTWILCYGAALLAMGGVAPRSLRRLGWAFMGAGAALFLAWKITGNSIPEALGLGTVGAASAAMIVTFGLMHLAHGIGVLLRKGSEGEPA